MGGTEQSKTVRGNCSTLFQHRQSGNGKAVLNGISAVFLFLHKCLKSITGLVFFSLQLQRERLVLLSEVYLFCEDGKREKWLAVLSGVLDLDEIGPCRN